VIHFARIFLRSGSEAFARILTELPGKDGTGMLPGKTSIPGSVTCPRFRNFVDEGVVEIAE
jgi:hypothetical protein